MKTRVLTGIILAVVLIPLLFVPPVYLYGFVGVLVLIASYELFNMYRQKTELPRSIVIYQGLGSLGLYGTVLGVYLGYFMMESLLLWLMSLTLIGLMLTVLIESFRPVDLGKALLGIVYVGLTFAAVSMLRAIGIETLVYLLILAMITDMFAYFIGVKFGRRRIAPKISPKKSLEGSIGGTTVAVIGGSVYAYYTNIFPFENLGLLMVVLLVAGVFVSVTAQMGDLVASRLKRDHEIKDFSNLFPGHGGVLDRFDSSMFAALALMIIMLIIEVL